MPSNLKYTTAARDGQLSDLNTRVGASCHIRLYDGTQPANANTAITTQVLLVEWTGNAGGFGSVSGGVLTANAVANVNAVATGTATWFRITTSGGTAVIDGNAGLAGATPDMVLTSTSIVSGVAQAFNSLAITGGNA
jgi:hypothetical protein